MTKPWPVDLMLGLDEKGLLLRYFIVEGYGGPLLLLWSIGIGLFLLIGSPIYAVAWTGVAVTLGLWMTYGNPKVWERWVYSSIAKRVPWHTLSDEGLQDIVRKSSSLVAEVTLKVYGLQRASGARDELGRVLAAASKMLDLQLELVQKAEGLARGLSLIVSDSQVGASLITDAPTVHRDIVAAVRKQIAQARTLAGDLYQQLETLLLQVCQLEALPNIPAVADNLASEIEANLNWAKEKISILNQSSSWQDESHSPPDLKPLVASLRAGFSRNESTEGLMALERLTYEYTQLRLAHDRRKEDVSLLAVRIPALGEETYRQGLSVLQHALELVQALRSSDEGRLAGEAMRLEKEIEALHDDASQASHVELLHDSLACYQQTLRLIQQQALRVEELLNQAGRCEASLNQARIQLVSFSTLVSEKGADAVIETLSRVIQQAKEVQEELKELGF